MNFDPEPDSHGVNSRLADYLCAQRESIIGEWLGRVRGDPDIPTDSLSTPELKDHVPWIFDDLADTLRGYGTATSGQTDRDSAIHAGVRWRQGYRLSDVLRELKHLRTNLIYRLRAFEELNADFVGVARLFALEILHRFLDDVAISAADQYLRELRTSG